jgi:peptide/nickel transport system substrate-binding protein
MGSLKHKRLYVLLAILIIFIVLFTSCGSNSSSSTGTFKPVATITTKTSSAVTQTSAVPTSTTSTVPSSTIVSPKYGGKVTKGIVGSPINLGYSAKRAVPGDTAMSSPCAETLMDLSFGTYIPRLAESWDIAPDGKFITFHIRKGVKFHDGTTLNAAAVKVNYDLVRTTGELTALKAVNSVDVVDEYTLRLSLNQFDWGLMSYLATNSVGRIYSAKALTENTPEQLLFKPVGAGPFKFVSYQKDTLIKYVRFDDYWQPGKPYLDAVDVKIFADATTATMAMKAGEVDVMTVSAEDMLDLKKSRFIVQECIGRNAMMYPDGANADSPFADVRVRKALSHAIDRKKLADSLGYGYYYPTYQLYGEWSTLAYNPKIIGQPYDPAKAKQLLAEAGYPNGFKTSIIIGTAATDVQLALQDMLAQVGIQATIQEVTSAKYSELSAKGWRNGSLYAQNPLGEGHQDPAQNVTNSYAPESIYYPSDLKALYESSRSEMDIVKRKAILQEFMKKVSDDYCMVIHLYITTTFIAVNPDVHIPEMKSFFNVNVKMEDVWRSK